MPAPDASLDLLLAGADALIFDCDGTLVNSAPAYAHAWAHGFALSGRSMAAEWYHERAGLSEHVLMDDFEALHGIALDRNGTVAIMRAAFLDRIGTLRGIEAVAEIARASQGRCPMAVASGGPASIVLPSLRATGLFSLFDTVVTFDDVGRAKPEPDLFLVAASRLNTPPGRCLVFEDSAQGLEAARRAGMKAVDVADLLPPTGLGHGSSAS